MGTIIACWGRWARGIIAPSWGLSEEIKLVKRGPYKFVRHPLYSSYIILFIAFPLLTMNLLTMLCLPGIIGYYLLIKDEEKLLLKHFGNEYQNYIEQTGRFFPRLSISIRKKT
jgi:protein-S-isoprenylcysteine O-methyltransferase Ste14